MDDECIGAPIVHIILELLVPLEEVAVRYIPLQHVACDALKGSLRIVPEAELPYAPDGRVRRRYGHSTPSAEHVTELSQKGPWRGAFHDDAKLFLRQWPFMVVRPLLHLFVCFLKEPQSVLGTPQAVEWGHHHDGIEIGIKGSGAFPREPLDVRPQLSGLAGKLHDALQFLVIELLAAHPLQYFDELLQLLDNVAHIFLEGIGARSAEKRHV